MTAKYIGIDLGGTKIDAGIANEHGKLLASLSRPTEADQGKLVVLNKITNLVNDLIQREKISLREIRAIGIGAPGPILHNSIILNPPNLKGWKQVNLKQYFEKRFKRPVCVDNDANAAALAEYKWGAGQGSKNMVYLTISTGIGGGIIFDGKLYRGSGGIAGEAGHMVINPLRRRCGCGKRGCLEALAAGPALEKEALEKLGKELTPLDLEKLGRQGDRAVLSLLGAWVQSLAVGVSNIVNLLSPERVVIGGGLSHMGELLFPQLRKRVKDLSMEPAASHVKVVPAKLGRSLGILGAVAICLDSGAH